MLFNFTAIQSLTIVTLSVTILPIFFYGLTRIRTNHSEYVWVLPLVSALLFVCIDIAGKLVSGGNIRYIGTIMTFIVILVLKGSASVSNFSSTMKFAAFPLVTIAVAGSLFGRIYNEEQFGALPIAIPMLILFTKFPTIDSQVSLKRSTNLVIYLCMVITAESSLVRLHVLPSSALLVFSHEKTFCMVLGLLLSMAVRSKSLAFIQSALILSSFALYPAATLPLGVMVGLLTLKYSKTLLTPFRLLSVALIFIVTVILSIFRAQLLLDSSGSYFAIVGKSNNTSYRLSLVNAAVTEIGDRPIFGTFFKGSATVRAYVLDNRNYQLPVHNDYITLVLCGGLACLALFLMMILTLNFRIMVIYTQMSDDRSRVVSALLGSMYALLVSSFVNPVLINPGNSTIFYVIVMTIIALAPSKDKTLEKKSFRK